MDASVYNAKFTSLVREFPRLSPLNVENNKLNTYTWLNDVTIFCHTSSS